MQNTSYTAPSMRRKEDACILISQDNNRRTVTIDELDDTAAQMFGVDVCAGKLTLEKFLDHGTKQLINDHLDFEDINHDVGHVLRHARKINIITNTGQTLPVKIRVFSHHSNSQDQLRFQLLIKNNSTLDNIDRFKIEFQRGKYIDCDRDTENGHLTHSSTIRTLEMLEDFNANYHNSLDIAIGMAKIRTINAAQYRNELANKIRQSVREYDFVGYYDEDAVIVMLLDCKTEHNHSAMSRIRDKISTATHPVALEARHIKHEPEVLPMLKKLRDTLD